MAQTEVRTPRKERRPLTDRQMDRRLASAPALEAEEIEEAHDGEYLTIVSLEHLDVGGRDYDGKAFRASPGRPCTVTERKAKELLVRMAHIGAKYDGDGQMLERPRSVPGFAIYDEAKHSKLVPASR